MGPSRPNPAGGWGLRSISLSFVVNDAGASPPPLFATSPRKTHPQTSSYLWKGVLSLNSDARETLIEDSGSEDRSTGSFHPELVKGSGPRLGAETRELLHIRLRARELS